ncbi:alcohol dehydrogenase [Amylibacter marinus]|uniref:Alcohol dehydrogenase n=1 Tax=Amylibacter marinus TaxID=1475483 RepID=A0ABQ5VWB7_9RHOB|nr:zinc-binding dehydrogenase [Amylibacter marinus]GLQ35604.1 alcohol dehydrogenase [Amylibacter marinus]
MKAAVCRSFGQPLQIEEVTLAPPSAGQVHIRVDACAICHSDIAFIDGTFGGDLPAVYGHEAAGRVIALGEGVSDCAIGDHVIATLMRSCGTCGHCMADHPTSCSKPYDRMAQSPLRDAAGKQLEHGMAIGAFAQEIVVDQSQIMAVPAQMDMDVASLLSCGVITGFGAVTNSARMPRKARVVVIGAGGVGLNTIQGAALNGAEQIIAVDLSHDKLDVARDFGATDCLISDGTLVARVMALTGIGADFVFVTVGAISAFNIAPDLLAPRGEVIIVGMPPVGAKASYQPVNLASASQAIRGSKMGETVLARDIPMLLDLYQRGALKLDELISNRYSLDQINEAIADTKSGNAKRNVIVFD